MEKNRIYQVAGHCFRILGESLCKVVDDIDGFKPFEVSEGEPSFSFVEGIDAPNLMDKQYHFTYEDVVGQFGRTDKGDMLILTPKDEESLFLWTDADVKEVQIKGNLAVRLCRFAWWVGYGLKTLPYDTVAIHSSCSIFRDRSVLFLGESGTGKSTHTRLWRENIDGAELLNDDSPNIKVENGSVWAYGSPWSGKTPCYKQERYELKACVRLSQAPYNSIRKLSVLEAYGAIHPSCPPEFAYDDRLCDCLSNFMDKLLSNVPFYHLACLPDKEACLLSYKTLFNDETDSE